VNNFPPTNGGEQSKGDKIKDQGSKAPLGSPSDPPMIMILKLCRFAEVK